MRRVGRLLATVLLSLVALAVIGIAGAVGTRAYLQHRNAEVLAIRTPRGIDEQRYVKLGGLEQYIEIRGNDRANPVLLLLNGGPGVSWAPLTMWQRSWEDAFTLVYWDQRGEGKTLERDGLRSEATMTIPRMTQDGIELAAFLRAHLQKKNILVLGHSWGSILGVHMVKARPDLFGAYIGTGQVGDLPASLRIAYVTMLYQAAKAENATALRELSTIGPPPYGNDLRKTAVLFRWIAVFAPASDERTIRAVAPAMFVAPDYTLRDMRYRTLGIEHIPGPLYAAALATNLGDLGYTFRVPVYIIQGADDSITVPSVARAYFDRVVAPRKGFVLLSGTGHLAVWTAPDAFLRALVAQLGMGRAQRSAAIKPAAFGARSMM